METNNTNETNNTSGTLDLTNYIGAYDSPDPRDFTMEEIFEEFGEFGGSNEQELPKKVILDIVPPLNQGSIGACTLFGSAHAYFETYAQAIKPTHYEQPFELWEIWNIAKTKGATDNGGWYYQAMLQLLTDLKKIGGYALLRLPGNRADHAILKIKQTIASGRAVVGGSSHTDWTYAINTGKYREQNAFSGHIYAYTGYDDEKVFDNGDVGGLWAPNNWGGRGGFWISYNQFKDARQYSNYALLLTEDHERLAKAKQKRKTALLQKAFDAKIYNGENEEQVATASEIRIMVNRGLGLPDDYKWLRVMVKHLVSDKIVKDKMQVSNEERPYDIASDDEFAKMFTRGATRNPKLEILVLSRMQVAEIVARDFMK